jgi:very-short-patch-repair endonuclease
MENNKIITKDYFESKVTIIIDKDKAVWFKGCDVATILGYGNSREAMKKHIYVEDKIKFKELMSSCGVTPLNSQPHTIFINEKGLKSLVCKSRMSKSIDLAKLLQIDINNHKYECKESETLRAIMKAFKGENMKEQYAVLDYRLDLYFPTYNLAIECDEFNHKDRCPIKEKDRYDKITKKLNCKWLRFDPDDKDFSIFDVINRIFLIIKR